jgi:NAD(P)H-dependent FMN reductase
MENFKIALILGTGREGANSQKIFDFIFQEAKNFGFDVYAIKVKDWLDKPYTGGMSENKRNKMSEILNESIGFIIVSPEYNHSFPGELKLFLDEFYEEFNYKPVGICGVSVGKLGGARMVESLRLVLIEFMMIPLRNAVYFSNVGNFDNEKENYKEFLKNLFEELKFYINKLKSDSKN